MFAIPAPTQYQEMSGNGRQFAPKDLMDYQTKTLLNGLGYLECEATYLTFGYLLL
jgi:hypothetical protein